jgi:hypothetical protein
MCVLHSDQNTEDEKENMGYEANGKVILKKIINFFKQKYCEIAYQRSAMQNFPQQQSVSSYPIFI